MTDPIKQKIQRHFVIAPEPITLAVVLRAIGHLTPHGRLNAAAEELIKLWILETDNYDDQSQEIKDFIGSLLGIETQV